MATIGGKRAALTWVPFIQRTYRAQKVGFRCNGVVDTRNPKKPLSTNVQITGRTFEGKISTHTFTLGDETSMAANVCGPAFGYLKTGVGLQRRGLTGLFTAAEVMPHFVR